MDYLGKVASEVVTTLLRGTLGGTTSFIGVKTQKLFFLPKKLINSSTLPTSLLMPPGP